MLKREFTRFVAKYIANPITKLGAGRVTGTALLETVGRKSGLARQTPVGYHLDAGTVWIVAEHGLGADYVRNIKSNPSVRLKIGGRWLDGSAHLSPQEDPKAHLKKQPNKLSAATVRLMATTPMVIRIDLDQSGSGGGGPTSSGSTL